MYNKMFIRGNKEINDNLCKTNRKVIEIININNIKIIDFLTKIHRKISWILNINKEKKTMNIYRYRNIFYNYNKMKVIWKSFRKSTYDIKSYLFDLWIHFVLNYRIKTTYSIYTKSLYKWFNNINDIYWIRLITNTDSNCYRIAEAIIKYSWVPPQKIKDYIKYKKPNGYQSIHITSLWLIENHPSQPIEIQIRTYKMHETAETWTAAHREYKNCNLEANKSRYKRFILRIKDNFDLLRVRRRELSMK